MSCQADDFPRGLAEILNRQQREGVSYGTGKDAEGNWTVITDIMWRPGDPNAVVEAIIAHVGQEEMKLVLDGNEYLIRRTS